MGWAGFAVSAGAGAMQNPRQLVRLNCVLESGSALPDMDIFPLLIIQSLSSSYLVLILVLIQTLTYVLQHILGLSVEIKEINISLF